MSHEFTDIVIPVHNALPFLRHCVHTVCEFTNHFRIIFVDDYSDEETSIYLHSALKDHKDWVLIRNAKQRWFTRAANLGLQLTRTNRVLLLNSDCEVNFGWLQELHDVMDLAGAEHTHWEIGLVGSITHALTLPRWIETQHSKQEYVSGHCYLLNMSVLKEFSFKHGRGGLIFNEKDPAQIHIASDRILCWDLNDAGYITIGCYHAAVGHHGGKSWGHRLDTIPKTLKEVD